MKPYETLTVCGSEIHLKITTANAVKLEEQLGTDLLSGLEKLAEVKTLAKYYFAAAVSLNDSINSIDDVYQLFDDYVNDGGEIDTLQKLMIEVLLVSGILSKETYDMQKKMTEKQMEALLEMQRKLLN
jgi:hypothetical protein